MIIQPKYNIQDSVYRIPDSLEGNGISKYDFLISPLNKQFIYKSDGNTILTTIDFLSLDNIVFVNGIFTTNPTYSNKEAKKCPDGYYLLGDKCIRLQQEPATATYTKSLYE